MLVIRTVIYALIALGCISYVVYLIALLAFTGELPYESKQLGVLSVCYLAIYSVWDHTGDIIRVIRLRVKSFLGGRK